MTDGGKADATDMAWGAEAFHTEMWKILVFFDGSAVASLKKPKQVMIAKVLDELVKRSVHFESFGFRWR